MRFVGRSTADIAILPILVLLIGAGPALAGSYSMQFNRVKDVYSWSHSLQVGPYGERIQVSGSANMRSELTKARIGTRKNRWKDFNSSSVSIRCPLTSDIAISFRGNVTRRKDNFFRDEAILTGNFSSLLDYKPFKFLSFTQSVGQAFDKRRTADFGRGYSFGMNLTPSLPKGLSGGFSFNRTWNELKRSSSNSSLSANLGYSISTVASTRISFSESRQDNKYYHPIGSENLEDRFINTKSSSINLTLKPHRELKLKMNLTYDRTDIDDSGADDPTNLVKFGTNGYRENRGVSMEVSTGQLIDWLNVDYAISYGDNSESYDRRDRNKDGWNISMKCSARLRITPRDTLSLNGTVARYTVNTATPDPMTDSDRDNFQGYLRASYSRGLGGGLSLRLNASTDQNHQVYIRAAKSAQNRWIRRFNLSPALYYRPSENFSITQSYSLSTNYIEYDFDSPDYTGSSLPRSNISRSLSYRNVLNWYLMDGAHLSVSYKLNRGDSGNLFRTDGGREQLLTEERSGYLIRLSLSLQVTDKLNISPSFSYGMDRSWRYSYKGNRRIRRPFYNRSQNSYSLDISYGIVKVTASRSERSLRTGRVIDRYFSATLSRAFTF